MSSISNTHQLAEYLIFAFAGFAGITIIFGFGIFFDQENNLFIGDLYLTDILFIILPVIVIGLGMFLLFKSRLRGNHGKAWLFFVLAISSWYVGELTFSYDVELDPSDISTLTADIFWILGYPLFFTFTIFFLKPRKNIISKKIIISATIASLIFLVPSLHITVGVYEELDDFEVLLYGIYPVLDSIILIPSIIAVILFYRGQVNLLWILILLATFTDITADTLYLSFELDDSYQVGHPIDILFLWSYVFYALGVWSFIRTFNMSEKPRTDFT